MDELFIVCSKCGEAFKEDSTTWITPILFEHQHQHQLDGDFEGWEILPESEAM